MRLFNKKFLLPLLIGVLGFPAIGHAGQWRVTSNSNSRYNIGLVNLENSPQFNNARDTWSLPIQISRGEVSGGAEAWKLNNTGFPGEIRISTDLERVSGVTYRNGNTRQQESFFILPGLTVQGADGSIDENVGVGVSLCARDNGRANRGDFSCPSETNTETYVYHFTNSSTAFGLRVAAYLTFYNKKGGSFIPQGYYRVTVPAAQVGWVRLVPRNPADILLDGAGISKIPVFIQAASFTLSSSACTVTTPNVTVKLPTLGVNALRNGRANAYGQKEVYGAVFDIAINQCHNGQNNGTHRNDVKYVDINFTPQSGGLDDDAINRGMLPIKQGEGMAQGVKLNIYPVIDGRKDGFPINYGADTSAANDRISSAKWFSGDRRSTVESATRRFIVNYVTDGQSNIVPGKVEATATFTFSYQ